MVLKSDKFSASWLCKRRSRVRGKCLFPMRPFAAFFASFSLSLSLPFLCVSSAYISDRPRIISSGTKKKSERRSKKREEEEKVKLWHIFFSFRMLPFFPGCFFYIGVFLLYVIPHLLPLLPSVVNK